MNVKLRFLTVMKEHRFRLSENGALRKIFGPKGEDVSGCWRSFLNVMLHNLFSSPNVRPIRMIKLIRTGWVEHVAYMREIRYAYKTVGRKPERKRQLGRPRRRYEDNIKIDYKR
jgi:hypothetical protein